MIPALYTHAGAALLAGALAFAGAWQIQAWRMMNMKSKLLRFKQSNKEKQWRKLSSNCSRRSKNKKKKKECEKNSDTN